MTPCTVDLQPRLQSVHGQYRRGSLSGEFAAIARLAAKLPAPPSGETWIGDDAAVVTGPDGVLLLATDIVVDGVHIDRAAMGSADVGWKAVSVNVSDIAAMGGRPLHLLAAVAGPPGTDIDGLAIGMAEAAATYGCHLVGGDLSNAPTLVLAVAVTGTVHGSRPPVLRSGARAGDAVWVTGPLGGAAAAGYVRRPHARLAEGQAARSAGATAMIDVSDGFAADLGHLATASGVGVALDRVPVAPGATLAQALTGGDDYELVFTLPPGTDGPGERIGVCTHEAAERTLEGEPLPAGGWEHVW